MRRLFFGAAIALWILSGGTCAGTGFLALAAFEPPHPEWSAPVAHVPGHTELQQTGPLADRDYYVWVTPEKSSCTLEVIGSDTRSLGQFQGTSCSLTLHARAGDTWTIHATSVESSAQEHLAEDPKLLRQPFNYGAWAGVGMFVAGALAAAAAMAAKRRAT